MNSYAIQHIGLGFYISPQLTQDPHFPHLVRDPDKSYQFVSRAAAQQYIDRNVLADNYVVATLPGTRPLLSVPMERQVA